MINQEKYKKEIIESLSWLEIYIKNINIIRLFDINIIAESFFADFLSILYNTEYINANLFEKNITSIDLINTKNLVAIQVSSDNSLNKVKETLKKFEAKKYYEKYKTLKFLFLKDKKKYNVKTNGNYKIEFLDIKDLCKYVDKIDIDTLKKLKTYIKESLHKQSDNKLLENINISTEDIKDIINFLFDNKIINNENDSRCNYSEYPGLKEKNTLNNISENYFNNAIVPDMSKFAILEKFLKDPRNTEYCEKYYNIATEIRNKLLVYSGDYSLEQALTTLYDIITRTENLKTKRLVYFILHYMYCQCDIGRNK